MPLVPCQPDVAGQQFTVAPPDFRNSNRTGIAEYFTSAKNALAAMDVDWPVMQTLPAQGVEVGIGFSSRDPFGGGFRVALTVKETGWTGALFPVDAAQPTLPSQPGDTLHYSLRKTSSGYTQSLKNNRTQVTIRNTVKYDSAQSIAFYNKGQAGASNLRYAFKDITMTVT